MPAESAADRLSYFSTNDFAVSATIGANTVLGILDNEFVEVDMQGYGVESNRPVFTCRTADLPAITIGTTTCTISGTAYVIIENMPDGTGITDLRLREPS